MARNVSGLNAVRVLLETGYLQEVGVLLRTLDEIQEDIMFLATAGPDKPLSDHHTKFLNAFYTDAIYSRPEGDLEISKPDIVPRKKIRAYMVEALGDVGVNKSKALKAGESLSAAYSGFVHAASENIMDMYGGDPQHFHVQGLLGTPRVSAYAKDVENYIYRGQIATICAAKAFGDRLLVDALHKFLEKYESANGHSE